MANISLSFQKSPSLPYVEMRRATSSSACFHTHTHDEFSFGVIDSGAAIYQNQQSHYHIGQGTTVTINPGEVHSCNPEAGAWSYRMLFVNTQRLGELQQELFGTPSNDYRDFFAHRRDDPSLLTGFNELYSQLQQSDGSLAAETQLLSYVQQLFPEQPCHLDTPDRHRAEFAQQLIMDELDINHSLLDLAQASGLSRFHFVRSFKHRYGQTPHAYQLDHRIKKSKRLLETGESLSNIAHMLGFSDQAHFQRHFKKRLAITPKQYQGFFVSNT